MFDFNKIYKKLLVRLPVLRDYQDKVSFIESKNVRTASTSGTIIFYNSEFFSSISKDEQLFTLAHEFLHIILKHIPRLKGKDIEIWNYATDAVINQMLLKMGFHMPLGLIDCPDAINYSSEEYYEMIKNRPDCEELMDKYRDKRSNEEHITTHETWSIEPCEIEPASKDNSDSLDKLPNISEKDLLEKNKELVHRENSDYVDRINNESTLKTAGNESGSLDNIGEAQPAIDWTLFLQKYKRKIISADYNLNNGEFNEEGFYVYPYEVKRGCDVEIVIDTSISVDDNMIRAFLRECKNIFNETKIKIGCFDTKFYGFHEINSLEDIDNFVIEGRGCTDFNPAVEAFSPKSNVKIIFTDGGASVPNKAADIIWLLWEKKEFNPPGGTVLYVDPNTLNYSESTKVR